jgi:hypothetical protein
MPSTDRGTKGGVHTCSEAIWQRCWASASDAKLRLGALWGAAQVRVCMLQSIQEGLEAWCMHAWFTWCLFTSAANSSTGRTGKSGPCTGHY